MKIAVTGSSGLVGSKLCPALSQRGHQVLRLVRREPSAPDEVRWDPKEGLARTEGLDSAEDGLGAVVHLAGKGLDSGRWTESLKEEIRSSRVEGTRNLCEDLAGMAHRPRVLVAASAVGYYGSRGEEELTEASGPGDDFLARVCQGWEQATEPAREAGIRVVNLRFGMILDPSGGALAKMLLPFKLGLGGVIGSGDQFWSWVSIRDVLGVIRHALDDGAMEGPVNTVGREPTTNRQFTKTLGRVLKRPTIFPMPAFAARLAFGEMADLLLLASQRVRPARLESSGYEFEHPELEGCLRDLL